MKLSEMKIGKTAWPMLYFGEIAAMIMGGLILLSITFGILDIQGPDVLNNRSELWL